MISEPLTDREREIEMDWKLREDRRDKGENRRVRKICRTAEKGKEKRKNRNSTTPKTMLFHAKKVE